MKNLLLVLVLLTSTLSFSQNYEFGKVSVQEVKEQFYPLDSTAPAAYLFKSRKNYFEYKPEDGLLLTTEIFIRVKVYSKEGFDYATRNIYYRKNGGEAVRSLKALVYSVVNGKLIKEKVGKSHIFDEKKNKYWNIKKISMPNITEGVVFELKYKIISPYWNIDDFQFQYGIPVKNLVYVSEIPEYFKYAKNSKGYYHIIPIISTKKRSFTWGLDYFAENTIYSARDIPAIKDTESYVSNVSNYRGGVSFELASLTWPNEAPKYYSKTWEDVSKQIYESESFGDELKKTKYFINALPSILDGATTESEKIVNILQHVKKRVKWDGFYGKHTDKGVKKAYQEGTGNIAEINLILTAMLREAGLKVNPVLLSTRNNGVPIYPTSKGLNYVIAAVEMSNGAQVLLDASEPYSSPNILPIRTINWHGQLVKPNGSATSINLSPTKHSVENKMLQVSISEDGIATGTMRSRLTLLNALNHRKRNNHLKDEVIIAELEEDYNIEIDRFKVSNENELSKPIGVQLTFESEDLVEEINNKLYVQPLLFLANTNNPFKAEERKFPVDFASPWTDKYTVSITIPEGYSVASFPKSIAVGMTDDVAVFKYQITQKGNTINTIAVTTFNKGVVGASYYKELKEFYNMLTKKQAEKIVLVKN